MKAEGMGGISGLGYVFEYSFIGILVLGLIFSFVLDNLFTKILTIILFGILVANFKEFNKADLNFPYVLLVIGFLIGYMLAVKSGQRIVIVIFFFVGLIVGKFLKKYLIEYLGYQK